MHETHDLQTAGQLQRMLLPPSPYQWRGWDAAHHFQPAGAVSGDYLDLVPKADRLYFIVGDVSGKGVAASLLMAQLHAMFRTLIPFELPLEALMTRASALLCASSLPAQSTVLTLDPGDTLLVFTDGLTEARNASGEEYGARVERAAEVVASLRPGDQVSHLIADIASFRADMRTADDLTVLSIQRTSR
jgi:sigma-B regulation protein RsbU (phosphoserine phosphatase)